jgi:molecular chaperone DnaJ
VAVDHYAVLGLSREASQDDIKRAYRKLARELHPDVNPDPAMQDRFKGVTAAYEVLSDPEKRRMYDLGGDPFAQGGFNGGFGGFSDIVDAFFGQQPRGPRPRMRRGQDALIRVQVSLAEAAFGATRDLTVDTAVTCRGCSGAGTAPGAQLVTCTMCRGRGDVQSVQKSFLGQVMTTRQCPQCQGYGTLIPHPCPECSGDGRVRTRRTITVKIPAGVDGGTRIQMTGEAEVGPGGGPAGDLYIEIIDIPHPVFQRRGDDLHCQIAVPMSQAALGTTVSLELIDPDPESSMEEPRRLVVPIDIPAGTQPDSVITLRGKGVPHLRSSGRGDLLVHIDVLTPAALDDEQRELLERLAALRGEQGVARVIGLDGSDDERGSTGFFSRIKDAFNSGRDGR